MQIAKIFLAILVFFFMSAFAKSKASNKILDLKIKDNLKSTKAQVKVDKVKEELARARKNYPSIDNLHQHTMKSAEELDKAGTDLALKELALEFEKQFLSLMMQYGARGLEEGKNFAENVWNSELRSSIVAEGTELGQIGNAIYEELLADANLRKKNRGKK